MYFRRYRNARVEALTESVLSLVDMVGRVSSHLTENTYNLTFSLFVENYYDIVFVYVYY